MKRMSRSIINVSSFFFTYKFYTLPIINNYMNLNVGVLCINNKYYRIIYKIQNGIVLQ